MNPSDFLVLALQLSANPAEASQRSALSRGYYGVFHEAKELIELCGFEFSDTAETHEKLTWCLDAAGDPDLSLTARKLNTLRKMRNVADYDLQDARFRGRMFTSIQLGEIRKVVDCLSSAKARMTTFRGQVREYAATVLRKTLTGES